MRFLFFTVLVASVFSVQAQSPAAAPSSFKFCFGEQPAAKDFIAVPADKKFDYAGGYGFSLGSVVKTVNRQSTNPLAKTFVTSDQPFYFSVKIPEGNYDVKILLGDAAGVSATTIRAENRRLFSPISSLKNQNWLVSVSPFM